jgi:hypothetical protein
MIIIINTHDKKSAHLFDAFAAQQISPHVISHSAATVQIAMPEYNLVMPCSWRATGHMSQQDR